MSEYYLQNFHASRDSEFSEYDDLDLTDIKEARKAEIEAIRGGKSQNIDIYQINRKLKQGSAFKLEKYDKVSDLAHDQTDDEEKLIAHFLKKRDEKAKLAEGLRDKQQRMLELNEQIRKYDINQVRMDELDKLNGQMLDLNLQWGTLKTSLEEKLKFAEKMHKKHHEEVKDYQDFSENLDRDKFNRKVKNITFELYNEQKDFGRTFEQIQKKKQELEIFISGVKRDFQDEKDRNDKLTKQLIDIDGSQNATNEKLRTQIYKMKEEMDRINNYSIDIARDPASAIQRISDPILDVMNLQIEDYQEDLKTNLAQKKTVQQDLIDIKNSIFEEKVTQINLRRRREEIEEEFRTLREDIEAVQLQMLENVKRKNIVAEKIEQSTEKFQEEAKELRDELTKYQERLIGIFQHKEIVQDQSEFLQNDRGRVGGPEKYKESITEFIQLAKDLKVKFDAIQDRILKLDDELTLDPLYTRGQGKKARVIPIQEVYHIGKFEEREKKDTLMKDLEKKQDHIMDLIVTKENLEETLAPFGNIHHIYKTFKEVQEDIKQDIKKYIREKHQIYTYLNQLIQDFDKNRETIGLQEGNMKTQLARFKAVYYLLQEKLLRIRILEDELFKLKKVVIQSVGNMSDNQSIRSGMNQQIDGEDTVIAYERELVMRMNADKNQKDQEVKSLKQLLNERDLDIAKYQTLLDEKGFQQTQEEILIEEKMKNILARNDIRIEIEKIAKNAYKLGKKCFIYLKLQPNKQNNQAISTDQQMMKDAETERQLLVKVSLKGNDGLKKCKEHRIDGGDIYYEFDQFVKFVLINLN
eukprot:403364082